MKSGGEAEAVLGEHALGYRPLTQDSRAAIPADGELVLVPEIAGIEFNPPAAAFCGRARASRGVPDARGPELLGQTAAPLTCVLRFSTSRSPSSALSLRVAARAPTPQRRRATRARAYRRIFCVVLASRRRDR